MTMNITSKQMEITPAIRQHVADRLAKLEKWQTHLINPHIILSKEPQGFVADATINTPNGVLVASGKHPPCTLSRLTSQPVTTALTRLASGAVLQT